MIIKKNALLILLLGLILIPLYSDENTKEAPDILEISLAFIGPADPLYSWWGHVAVIVENVNSGAARYYDYGNFSFEQDSFVQNFVMGRLYFLKMGSAPDRQLRYSAYLNRDVTIYKLNIPPEKEIELYRFLENDILPENRVYLYDHFYDNCSTRIRDMMDMITDDQFSKTYAVTSDRTLRMQLRRFLYTHPLMDWVLNFALNGASDRSATELDGMFLPMELENGVSSMMVEDANGNPIPFVKEVIVYNRSQGRAEIKAYPPPRWPAGLVVGAVLAAAAWLLGRGSEDRRLKRNSLAAFSAVFSLLLAIPGTLLFLMAVFTDHTFTYWNMNLLFANPFLFVTFVFSIRLLIKRKAPLQTVRRCWVITGAGAILSILLKVIPLCRQDNWETLLIVLPAAIIMGGLPKTLRRQESSKQSPM